MTRACTICAHPERETIDAAIVGGESYRNLAERFGVSIAAIARHKAAHISKSLALAQEAAEVARGDDLLAQVVDLQKRTLAILDNAEQRNDGRLAIAAIAEARRNLELLGKLAGELQQEGTLNVVIAPQWVTLRTVIMRALEPYPEARLAVAEAIDAQP